MRTRKQWQVHRRTTQRDDGQRRWDEAYQFLLHHLAEGCGQRRICRLVGVSRDVVRRLTLIAGNHGKALHDELVTGIHVNEAQADEKWSFVGKKRGSLPG